MPLSEPRYAFRTIGLTKWASLLEDAMKFFGPIYPRDRSRRQSKLPSPERRKREQWDPFYKLDDQFYSCRDGTEARWEIEADKYVQQLEKS